MIESLSLTNYLDPPAITFKGPHLIELVDRTDWNKESSENFRRPLGLTYLSYFSHGFLEMDGKFIHFFPYIWTSNKLRGKVKTLSLRERIPNRF